MRQMSSGQPTAVEEIGSYILPMSCARKAAVGCVSQTLLKTEWVPQARKPQESGWYVTGRLVPSVAQANSHFMILERQNVAIAE